MRDLDRLIFETFYTPFSKNPSTKCQIRGYVVNELFHLSIWTPVVMSMWVPVVMSMWIPVVLFKFYGHSSAMLQVGQMFIV